MVRKSGTPGKIIQHGNSKVVSMPPGWLDDFGLNTIGAEVVREKTPFGILTMSKKSHKQYLEAKKRNEELSLVPKPEIIETKPESNIEHIKTTKVKVIESIKDKSVIFPGDPEYISAEKVIPEKISEIQSKINETHKYFETRARKNFLTELDKPIVKEAFDLIAVESPERASKLPPLNIDMTDAINRNKVVSPLHWGVERGLFNSSLLKRIEIILEGLRV